MRFFLPPPPSSFSATQKIVEGRARSEYSVRPGLVADEQDDDDDEEDDEEELEYSLNTVFSTTSFVKYSLFSSSSIDPPPPLPAEAPPLNWSCLRRWDRADLLDDETSPNSKSTSRPTSLTSHSIFE
jgi:hypothetical protein